MITIDDREEGHMEISKQELDGGILKLTLNGDLDAEGSATADTHIAGFLETFNRIIVDLKNVDFLASAGIRVLVKSAKAVAAKGGKFAIIHPNDAARRVMWTTGLDNIVPIADDEQAAIGAVS